MVYEVEIESQNGERAVKEYDTRTVRELAREIYRDLREYPGFHINGAWHKGQPRARVLMTER
jgi:hypothetical protein